MSMTRKDAKTPMFIRTSDALRKPLTPPDAKRRKKRRPASFAVTNIMPTINSYVRATIAGVRRVSSATRAAT